MGKISNTILNVMKNENRHIGAIPPEEFRAYKIGFGHGFITAMIVAIIITTIIYMRYFK